MCHVEGITEGFLRCLQKRSPASWWDLGAEQYHEHVPDNSLRSPDHLLGFWVKIVRSHMLVSAVATLLRPPVAMSSPALANDELLVAAWATPTDSIASCLFVVFADMYLRKTLHCRPICLKSDKASSDC